MKNHSISHCYRIIGPVSGAVASHATITSRSQPLSNPDLPMEIPANGSDMLLTHGAKPQNRHNPTIPQAKTRYNDQSIPNNTILPHDRYTL